MVHFPAHHVWLPTENTPFKSDFPIETLIYWKIFPLPEGKLWTHWSWFEADRSHFRLWGSMSVAKETGHPTFLTCTRFANHISIYHFHQHCKPVHYSTLPFVWVVDCFWRCQNAEDSNQLFMPWWSLPIWRCEKVADTATELATWKSIVLHFLNSHFKV